MGSVLRYLFLVAAFTLLLSGPAAAGKSEQRLSLEVASDQLSNSIQESPISILDYTRTQLSFLMELTKRLALSGKPMVGFVDGEELAGLEISILEQGKFDLTAGKFLIDDRFSEDWFFGLEWKGLPLLGDLGEIFERFRPQLLVYQKQVWFGISYEFRTEE